MRAFLPAIALAALAMPQAARACSYAQRPEFVGQTSGQYFANEMVAAASYVDLVLVEDDGVRAMNERPTDILTVRTIARLKGRSADRFTLFGTGLTQKPEAKQHFEAPTAAHRWLYP